MLGATISHAEFDVNLKADPHTLVVGGRGGEATIALQRIMLSAVSKKHSVFLLTSRNGAQDFLRYDNWLTHSASTEEEAAHTLSRIVAEVDRRESVLSKTGSHAWADLAPKVILKEEIGPWSVIIDDLPNHFRRSPTPGWAEKVLPAEYHRLRVLNEIKAKSWASLLRVAERGAAVGVHLVASAHSLNEDALINEVLPYLTARVMLVYATNQLEDSESTWFFPDAMTDVRQLHYELRAGSRPVRGHAVASGAHRSPSLIQVAPVISGDVDGFLRDSGVPSAKKWSL
jgi:hypothetical protein